MKTRAINSGIINKSCLVKTIVYRIYSSVIVFLISYVITGNLLISFSIGLLETIIKLFSYYIFDEVWSRLTGFKANPSVIWLAGTNENIILLANELSEKLKAKGIFPVLLNRGELKNNYTSNRKVEMGAISGMEVNHLASLFKSQGNVVIVSPVLPTEEIRNELRKSNTRYIEVSVSTDVKIYSRKSLRQEGKFKLSGDTLLINEEKEKPLVVQDSHIIFDSDGHSMDESLNKLLALLRK